MASENKISRVKKIWIDFDNSPHVLFFRPIISELRRKGYEIVITVRDCFQTVGLADMYRMSYHKIGKHFGKNGFMKVLGLFTRAVQLIPFVLREKPDFALSHGSRAQQMVANMFGINSIMLFDYEFSRSLPITRPRVFMAPEVVVSSTPPFMEGKLRGYPGLKEDVYVPLFTPDCTLRQRLGIEKGAILVTIRPPATEAHYHNPESEPIFAAIVDRLASIEPVRVIVLPRGDHQKQDILKKWSPLFRSGKLRIPPAVVDGLNLIWYSDLVISGGGTMNREAVALRVPVYSIFRGKLGAVDRYLSENGRLTLITSVEDIQKIKVEKRAIVDSIEGRDCTTLDCIVDMMVDIIEREEPAMAPQT